MLSLDLLIFVSLIYVAFLFGVAFWAERASDAGRVGDGDGGGRHNPLYCPTAPIGDDVDIRLC